MSEFWVDFDLDTDTGIVSPIVIPGITIPHPDDIGGQECVHSSDNTMKTMVVYTTMKTMV
jgi:hypothetical protein